MLEVHDELRLFKDEGGDCVSFDEPIPLERQYIHALDGSINLWTAYSCIAWTDSPQTVQNTPQRMDPSR
jgi:hypothetical protein